MCSTCGCEPHDHDAGHAHDHDHASPAGRRREVAEDVLGRNDAIAVANRGRFAAAGILALNLVSSPGSGKTTLLTRTIAALRGEIPLAVIEGDLMTSRDAERIEAAGATAYQINTGRGCHLDAAMVAHAVDHLAPAPRSLLFIENVGNLVCPSEFDLGEAARIVVLSVTEGDDKPLKYAPTFAAADLLILHKVDLLPHVEFDLARCRAYAQQLKPDLTILEVSSTRGDGMDEWLCWLRARWQEKGTSELLGLK